MSKKTLLTSLRRVASWEMHGLAKSLHRVGHWLDPADSYLDPVWARLNEQIISKQEMLDRAKINVSSKQTPPDTCTNGGSCVLKMRVREDPDFVMPDYDSGYDGYLRKEDDEDHKEG